jgi:hypothetical protein
LAELFSIKNLTGTASYKQVILPAAKGLIKAKYFMDNYDFIGDDEKDDSIEYHKIIERRINQLIKIFQI